MGRRSPGSLRSLRERNRLQVLEVVRGSNSVSRADIARRTGLARSTVSTLVNELLGAGLLVERGAPEDAGGTQGRPPVLLSFDPGAGAGLGIAGPIDQATGTVGSSAILPGWAGMPVAQALTSRLGLPVHVDNDANVGALAESVLGAGRGVSEMAYIMLGSGIGAGLIIGGQVYRGSGGTAGEIGHVLVDEHGPLCRCGNRGCLETYAGADALLDLLRRQHGDALTVDGLVELARGGDAARFVGVAAATLCNQLNPELLVIGGELAQTGALLLDPLRESIARYAIPAAAEDVRIVAGELGERAELLGALVLVLGRSDRALTNRFTAAAGG